MRDDGPGIRLAAPATARELAARFGGEADAEIRDRALTRVVPAGAGAASDDDLVLVARRSLLERAAATRGVLLAPPELAAALPAGRRFVHPRPLYVVARLLAELEPAPRPGAARSAVVHPGARVDPSAEIRDGAVVRDGARIGPGTVIAEGAVVYERVTLGARVVVGPNAVVGRPGFGFTEGPAGEVVRVPQLGGVVVEDDVEIGALATVDAGTLGPTVLRRGAKLDAHVHVAHNVEVGEGTLVAAQSGFAGSVRVGARALVGGQAGVADHVEVGDGARLAAQSGVIADVPAGATVAGYPALPRGTWLRAWAVVRRLAASGAKPPPGASKSDKNEG